MTESLFRRPYFWARLRTNPLAEIIEEYVAHFHGLRYSWLTIRVHVQGLEHFGCWLHSKRLDATAVNRKLVRSFICDHLPKCRCPAPAPKRLGEVLTLSGTPESLILSLRKDITDGSEEDRNEGSRHT